MILEKVAVGNYLNAKFVREHRLTQLEIKSEGEMVKIDNHGKEVEKVSLGIEYQGRRDDDPSTWTLNNKSRNALIDVFGSDTRNWVGKTVEIKLEGAGEYEHVMVDTMRTR